MDDLIKSEDELSQLIKSKGIINWEMLVQYVQAIPYGRNTNREDFSLVIKENKGTCSSKHALLKELAVLNEIEGVQLIIGMYKMSEKNTPKIGNALSKQGFDYLPEAHCYLKINGQQKDYTNLNTDFDLIKNDLISEVEIEAYQVGVFKVEYHKTFMTNWIEENKINKNFEEVWAIREQCILNLSS